MIGVENKDDLCLENFVTIAVGNELDDLAAGIEPLVILRRRIMVNDRHSFSPLAKGARKGNLRADSISVRIDVRRENEDFSLLDYGLNVLKYSQGSFFVLSSGDG